MKYEYFPHTADVKFRAYGSSLEEAFINSAYAYQDVVSDHSKIDCLLEKKINVSAEDKKALLYSFIEEFIVLLDTDSFLLAKIKHLSIKEKKGVFFLSAFVLGDSDPSKYVINTHVKAMTYQEMSIDEGKRFIIQVVLDI